MGPGRVIPVVPIPMRISTCLSVDSICKLVLLLLLRVTCHLCDESFTCGR